VSTDSRNISAGCVFFALKGDNFNGNLFAEEAINKGAIAAVVDEEQPLKSDKIIRVKHVLTALQHLAHYHRMHTGITLLAITGSNGKTTTKELCRAVLSEKFNVLATTGNLNNHIGVPLTLLALGAEHGVGVIEMGANHPGEIRTLCEIAFPDLGLITNIGKAHLEGFGGIEGVARAKGELFNHLVIKNKTILLNEGNSFLPPLVPPGYTEVVPYNGPKSLHVLEESSNPFLHMKVGHSKLEMEIETNLMGSYNAENVLAACTVGLQFGIHPQKIQRAIKSYQPKNNRSQLIKTSRNTVYMDAYNANPSSMSAAITEFLKIKTANKILILGEMREVGESSHDEHEEIIALLKENHISNVICVGKAFEKPALIAGYNHVINVEELNKRLTEIPLNGYTVFVKGSRSNQLEKVVEML
jgi:UDP-N-acetylmuramoyl-tripeptide--D-alanyl-D-alanine ligase